MRLKGGAQEGGELQVELVLLWTFFNEDNIYKGELDLLSLSLREDHYSARTA